MTKLIFASLILLLMAGCSGIPDYFCHRVYSNMNYTNDQFHKAVAERNRNATLESEREAGRWYGESQVWTDLYFYFAAECDRRWTRE
jgi:hypothetical protein